MTSSESTKDQSLAALSLAALGIVYGDIGTSPLYAFRESLGHLPVNLIDILGILSLIFWALIIIISGKYLCVVLRADNDGEGGVLALFALLKRKNGGRFNLFFVLGILGAGLMLGDGVITPAISVLSAIEGVKVITPIFSEWVLPASCVILILLFMYQSSGTAKIGFLFGPIIFVWFCTLGILGFSQIIQNPVVLKAMNPYHAFHFLHMSGWRGYALLGSVFLVVTGGEALYADLGHFGKKPIQLSWFLIALPGLLLNYFGQGAYLLNHPEAIINPFYLIAPDWFLVPLLFISTMATIIASQAVISATFSLTRQAIFLGLYPLLPIKQTSESVRGQIYIPQINFILAMGTLILIFTFKTSGALAHAYGISVNLVMMLTTIMVFFLAHQKWEWDGLKLTMVFLPIFFIELTFFGANVEKLLTGGWVPVLIAMTVAFIMYTWNEGMQYLKDTYYTKKGELSKMLGHLHYKKFNKIEGLTAAFITDVYDNSGGSFLHFLELNRASPENILIVSYVIENVPRVSWDNRFSKKLLDENICQLTLHYGFMDFISIPQALFNANSKKILPFEIDIDKITYFIEIPNIVASEQRKTLWFFWQEKLFSFLTRNYSVNLNIEFYQLPYKRTIAIGTYCII